MIGYSFTATCPVDGALLKPINQGQPVMARTRAGAVAECTKCGHQYLIAVEMVPITKQPDRRSKRAKASQTPSTAPGRPRERE